ncbi:MAG: transcription initiation factor IIB [Promethearchaeota archaeon]
MNCGTVISPYLINSERRAYNASEISSRRRTEPLWRCFGNRTIIGNFSTDARGKQLQPQRRALFARLSKIQGSLINSLERNYWEAKPKLNTLANRLAIPDFIQETAWSIYKISAKKKLTMGRSIEGFIAASVYAAIRVHQYPRLLEEVVDYSLLPLRNIHKSLGLIVREVLPDLGLRYSPIRSERLIFRFGNELKLSMPIQQKAKKLLFIAKRAGLERNGKDPKGIAAATLYLAAKDTDEKRTQSSIAHIARITEVTLRTRAKQISSYSQIINVVPEITPNEIE